MACFFRRNIAAKLGRTLQQSEDAFTSALSAVPVSKKQQSADFRLSINTLRMNGILPSNGDLQLQTEALASELKQDSLVEEISAGRGVINFRVHRKLLVQKMLEPFGKEDDAFGLNSELLNTLKKGTTLVEFSSPNIAKKFHAGHLRSTIIGHFIANLKQSLGNRVIRMNYLGDWGMQFGLLGAGFEQFGCQEKLKLNPLQHLFDVYVQVNREAGHNEDIWPAAREFFRQLEQGEGHAMLLWQQFRDITVKEYRQVYKRLGVHFDIYSGESFHREQAQEVVQQLHNQGLLKTTEKGTGVVDLSPAGDMTSLSTVLRSDGTSLYITRDLAAAIDRKEKYHFNEMIYVTDKSQENHFRQLFQILLAMGHSWTERCQHVSFGVVRGMKTRSGEVVFLEDVLDEARARMLHNMSQSKSKDSDTLGRYWAKQMGDVLCNKKGQTSIICNQCFSADATGQCGPAYLCLKGKISRSGRKSATFMAQRDTALRHKTGSGRSFTVCRCQALASFALEGVKGSPQICLSSSVKPKRK